MSWYTRAVDTIAEIHATLPPDADEAARIAALHAGYPFGERRYTPYKMWLKARREYLAKWSAAPAGPLFELPPSPLERSKAKADLLQLTREANSAT